MTEQEQIDLVAEEIMGWVKPASPGMPLAWMDWWQDTPDGKPYRAWNGYWIVDVDDEWDEDTKDLYHMVGNCKWNPAARWDHAGMLVDRMVEDGLLFSLHNAPGWYAKFHDEHGLVVTRSGFQATGPAAIFAAAVATLEGKP